MTQLKQNNTIVNTIYVVSHSQTAIFARHYRLQYMCRGGSGGPADTVLAGPLFEFLTVTSYKTL